MKNQEFDNYYEARTAIHDKIGGAMRLAYNANETMLSITLKMAAIGVLIATTIQVLVGLGESPMPSAGIWPVAVISALYLFSLRGSRDRYVQSASADFVEAERIAMKLHGLHGAPHDRLRDDSRAVVHARGFKKALSQSPPLRYYVSSILYMFGVMGIGNVLTTLAFTDIDILSSWVNIIQCACVIPGFILHRRNLREKMIDTEERSDMAAFHLAEFGLTMDKEHALGNQDDD